jgi:antitoxin YefM
MGLNASYLAIMGRIRERVHLISQLDFWRKVVNDQDAPLITRHDAENVVVMSQNLFDAWQETVYLLKSPANVGMLTEPIAQYEKGDTFEKRLLDDEGITIIACRYHY